MLSNGFKLQECNKLERLAAAHTFIYIAFAENPFQNARAGRNPVPVVNTPTTETYVYL
jgi:hypothetical protein